MENWMVSLLVVVGGIISTFSILHTNVKRLNEIIKELEKTINNILPAISQKADMKDIRNEFVTKEHFLYSEETKSLRDKEMKNNINILFKKMSEMTKTLKDMK